MESLVAAAESAASFLETPLAGPPLSLVGRQLGAYRVDAANGAGGMGEVYRAKDTRLGRDVAVKILPAASAADPQRRSRFEREARAVAALNHPNICTIHDVGHADGIDFLVMELVEGESLAARLARGPLPLNEALARAVEIAEALDRAHQQGIIHRDLKPGNVMLAKAGTGHGTQAKLLDFGLARILASPAGEGPSPTNDRAPMTEAGAMLGTLPYMAPEQIEGRPSDARTDIFAFGVLLYEMLTGRRVFEGTSSAALMAAILREEPPPVHPREVGRIVRRCLAKDPLHRYQSARDLLNDLEEARQTFESESEHDVDRTPSLRSRRGVAWIATAVVACAALVVAAYVGRDWFTPRRDVAPQRFQLQPPRGVTVLPSAALSALAMSPDGRWVAFRGATNEAALYLRDVGEVESRRIAEGNGPFFSPDSQWLGFFAGRTMYKLPLSSAQSQPQRICDLPNTIAVRGVSWGDDGTIVFSFERALWRVSAAGGEPQQLTRRDSSTPGNLRHYWPDVLPGSAAAVFTINEGYNDRWRRIAIVSLTSGEIRPLPGLSGTAPRYVSSGHLVYSRFGALHAAPFDVSRLEVTGEPVMVLEDVQTFSGSGSVGFDVSQSGALVYIPERDRFPRGDIVWFDRQGNVTTLEGERRSYVGAAIDHDGKRLVAAIADDFGEADLSILEIDSGAWMRLTRDMHTWSELAWSPDGQWVYFTSYKTGEAELYRVRSAGGAPEQLTSDVTVWEHPASVTPDGKTLLYWHTYPSQADLMLLALDPRGPPKHLTDSPAVFETGSRVSPDGRWAAFVSDASGRNEVHVGPFPGPDNSVKVTRTGGFSRPVWRRDSAELFFQRGVQIWSVLVEPGEEPGAPFRHRPARMLFEAGVPGGVETYYLVAQTATNRLAAIRSESPDVQLVYVPHWFDELQRRMREGRRDN